MSMTERRSGSILERNLLTGLMSIVTITIIFMAKFTFSANTDIQLMHQSLTTLNKSVDDLKTALSTANNLNSNRISELEKKAIGLEARIVVIEALGRGTTSNQQGNNRTR